jgi:hypothetical protein
MLRLRSLIGVGVLAALVTMVVGCGRNPGTSTGGDLATLKSVDCRQWATLPDSERVRALRVALALDLKHSEVIKQSLGQGSVPTNMLDIEDTAIAPSDLPSLAPEEAQQLATDTTRECRGSDLPLWYVVSDSDQFYLLQIDRSNPTGEDLFVVMRRAPEDETCAEWRRQDANEQVATLGRLIAEADSFLERDDEASQQQLAAMKEAVAETCKAPSTPDDQLVSGIASFAYVESMLGQ